MIELNNARTKKDEAGIQQTDQVVNPVFDFSTFSQNPTLTPKDILEDAENQKETVALNDGNTDLFLIRTANQCLEDARMRPIPKMLFGEFWFEGELCILFADTNLGKSILAVQIGDSISKNKPIPGFTLEAQRQLVLYFDFELTDKQFEARYSNGFEQHYQFDSWFHRAEINPNAVLPENFENKFEAYLNQSLERAIKERGTKILIIDNLTYLKNENEKAKDALPLMKHLKALKNKYGLSILALAHTPKRDLSKRITRNDLQGSKMLINFCDSAFAIGESHADKNIRYLKQIKARNTEIIYDSENVCLCQISKPGNFLQFEFLTFGLEREHLRELSSKDVEKRDEEIKTLKAEGVSNVEIGRRLGISEGAVRKRLKKADLEASQQN